MKRLLRPVLVYDGDCGFCKTWMRRWQARTGERVEYAPYQEAASRFKDVPRQAFAEAVHFIETGRVSRGAEAVFQLLRFTPYGGWPLAAYKTVPGFAPASEAVYRFVAGHRVLFSRLTRLLWGDSVLPPSYHGAIWLFLRLLGLIYLFAFVSLGWQVLGLIGKDGVWPAAGFLEAAAQQLGPERYRLLPTLAWLSASDASLQTLCWGGAAMSALVVAGVFQGPVLLLLWVLHLSIVTVGGDFLSFQWDNLLLETGLLAVFLAPWGYRARRTAAPGIPPALLRWLLFRLMLESGAVKLLSGDPSWRTLAALTFHYETQPLPTWIGWYAHQLPLGFQRFSAAVMFAIELGAPFLIAGPRRLRLAAAGAIAFLQVLIALTGNYGYFNLLTLALCLLLVDDRALAALPGLRWTERLTPAAALPPPRSRLWWGLPLAAGVLLLSGVQLGGLLLGGVPAGLAAALRVAEPLRSVNNYGLFAVMTTRRPEIVIEGSDDGATWSEYRFHWKPGDLALRPRFVAPHQPRLDWQLWFAALSSYPQNPWFTNLMVRLAQGSPPVLALLAHNPFPAAPPRFLRAIVYDYRFTTWAERRATGAWWKRQPRGLYCPVLKR